MSWVLRGVLWLRWQRRLSEGFASLRDMCSAHLVSVGGFDYLIYLLGPKILREAQSTAPKHSLFVGQSLGLFSLLCQITSLPWQRVAFQKGAWSTSPRCLAVLAQPSERGLALWQASDGNSGDLCLLPGVAIDFSCDLAQGMSPPATSGGRLHCRDDVAASFIVFCPQTYWIYIVQGRRGFAIRVYST